MAVDADASGSKLNQARALDETGASSVAPSHGGEKSSLTNTRPAGTEQPPPGAPRASLERRLSLIAGLLIVCILGGLAGWLGYRVHQTRQAEQRDRLILQIGRQAAVKLTTFNYVDVDAELRRVADSSTGKFHDGFNQRAAALAEVIKQSHSKSVGTATEAGIVSEGGDQAKVLVAVSVTTTTAAYPNQQVNAWRMRIDLQRIGEATMISNVVFV